MCLLEVIQLSIYMQESLLVLKKGNKLDQVTVQWNPGGDKIIWEKIKCKREWANSWSFSEPQNSLLLALFYCPATLKILFVLVSHAMPGWVEAMITFADHKNQDHTLLINGLNGLKHVGQKVDQYFTPSGHLRHFLG